MTTLTLHIGNTRRQRYFRYTVLGPSKEVIKSGFFGLPFIISKERTYETLRARILPDLQQQGYYIRSYLAAKNENHKAQHSS